MIYLQNESNAKRIKAYKTLLDMSEKRSLLLRKEKVIALTHGPLCNLRAAIKKRIYLLNSIPSIIQTLTTYLLFSRSFGIALEQGRHFGRTDFSFLIEEETLLSQLHPETSN